MSSAPRLAPSRVNWTPATAMLSAASALTGVVPETVAPAAGAETDTVGGVVSETGLATVTPTAAEVVALPAASRAIARRVWAPLVAVVVFQLDRVGRAGVLGARGWPRRG